jgi:hypothetical protein
MYQRTMCLFDLFQIAQMDEDPLFVLDHMACWNDLIGRERE